MGGEKEIGLPTSTSMSTHDKVFVTSVFSLLPPMPTSIQGIFFLFSNFFLCFLRRCMHKTNADVDGDVDVDLGCNLFTF